jgi:succinate dehydrogenase / fumarate reductase, cytochrome b subunit
MNALKKYLSSSIGRKQIMGICGIYLYLYLFIHLVGNIGVVAGAESYNKYGHLLLHTLGEIIVPIEISLFIAFVAHIILAIKLRGENRAARPVPYEAQGTGGKKTLYSSTMMVTGLVILFFTVIHIAHFRFGAVTGPHMVVYIGVEMRDLYRTMMEGFAVWWYTLAYVAVMLLIASHLAHGVQSSVQTLGFNHPKYTPFVLWFSRAYAVLISGGFSLMAVWAYFQQGGIP